MKWIKLTSYIDTPVWVNLENAVQIIRYNGKATTDIDIATGKGLENIPVKETPEEIFAAASKQNWG